MSFRILTPEEREQYAPELSKDPGKILLTDGNKFWIVKANRASSEERQRDFLGYLLGKSFANVAEVRLINDEEYIEISSLANLPDSANSSNTFLVRLAGSYSFEELPNKTLEDAVATELVYSVWIRRRDTHVDNRVYLNGIPIFFDHHIAFNGEGFPPIESFFNSASNDHGQAKMWRVKVKATPITTIEARVMDQKAFHYISNIEIFNQRLNEAKCKLPTSLDQDWKNSITFAGFTGETAEAIRRNLEGSLANLDSAIEKTKQIIFQ